MVIVEFKTQARALRRRVGAPTPTLESFREVLTFLDRMRGYSADVDYRDLLAAFSASLRGVVNPYRHRTILEVQHRDPGQLRKIKVWLELWVDALSILTSAAMKIDDWHATYDIALNPALAALIRMRRGEFAEASRAWGEAATICGRWLDENQPTAPGYGRLEADYYFFEARACRSLGQHTLVRVRPRAEKLKQAAAHFEAGFEHMQKSADIQTRVEGSAAVRELDQLKYLTLISKYQLAVLSCDIPGAQGLLDQLADLEPRTGFERLQYFGDSAGAQTEVSIERDFLDVFQSLLLGDLPGARVAADKLLANLPGETPETRRHISLRLRALATRLLAGDPGAHDDAAAIRPTEIGFYPANRYLLGVTSRLASNALTVESALDQVLAVFPLDALPPENSSEEASGLQALDWLPPFYLDWVDQWSDSPEGIGRIHFLQWQYVANVAEYLCRLHMMKKARGDRVDSASPMPPDFRLLGFRELREVLESARVALDWSNTDLPRLIAWIDRWLTTSQGELPDCSRLAADFVQCVAETSRFLYPHVVQVKEQTRLETGEVTVRLARVWRLPQRDLLLACLGAKGLLDGEYYFLKATFKQWRATRFSERREIVNFYRATTFAPLLTGPKVCVLVEGDHDEHVFRRLFDRFLPYWDAQVELRVGGGDALPGAYKWAIRDGYRVVVVADADKRGQWDELSPIWLTPDFEGVDLDALAEAMDELWRDSIGTVKPDRIREIIERDNLAGGTVKKLRSCFRTRTHTFLPDENDMKKELRSQLSGIWLKRGRLPTQISAVLTTVAKTAFGLASP